MLYHCPFINSLNYSCTAWPLTMGPIDCSETPVTDNQSMLRNIPEEETGINLTCYKFTPFYIRKQPDGGLLKAETCS